MHLRPDKAAKYDVVAGVMASAQRLGLTKIGIVGSEQFIEIAAHGAARGRGTATGVDNAMDFARQQRDPTRH